MNEIQDLAREAMLWWHRRIVCIKLADATQHEKAIAIDIAWQYIVCRLHDLVGIEYRPNAARNMSEEMALLDFMVHQRWGGWSRIAVRPPVIESEVWNEG